MQTDEITAPKLAVDCEVEHGRVSNLMRILELNPDSGHKMLLPKQLASIA
jgi:hypothetical protein